MLIKACQSLSTKHCHAKGRDLTLRIYCSCRQVDHRSRKNFAVCLMLPQQNRSIYCWFTGSAARRHCAQLVSKKFSASRKFPTIRYEVQWPDSDLLSLTWPLLFTSTPVLRRKTTSSRRPFWLAHISPSDSSSKGWCEETTQECNCTRLHMYWNRFAQSDMSHYTHRISTVQSHLSKLQLSESSLSDPPNKWHSLAVH